MLGKKMSSLLFETLYEKALKNVIICVDGDAWADGLKLYHELNGGRLYNKIKIVKLPKDKDICDLRGQIEEYYYEIVFENIDSDTCYWKEQELIKENWNNPLMINKTYHENINENKVWKNSNHSYKTKQKMSESAKGENNGFYGKKHTDESKRKISQSVSGKNHPFYGKPLTEEHKNKIKETKRKNPQYFSEECIKKMSIAKKKYWENKKLERHGES